MRAKTKNTTYRIVLSGVFLALGYIFAYFAANVQLIGQKFLPMHIPVLICGFICGAPYGAVVGALTPLIKSLSTGVPTLMPTAVAMMFELAVYGAVAGFLFKRFPKKPVYTYISLILAMVCGRVVWGAVTFVLYTFFTHSDFSLQLVVAQTVTGCIPGIVLQILLVPPVVLALKKVA